MRKALTALLVVSAVAFTAAYLPSATLISAKSCEDLKFIFARGSGQGLGAEEYSAFKSEIEAELKRTGSNLKYSFYELGSSSHGGSSYPAIELNPLNILSGTISAGKAFSYGNSVNSGISELQSYINEISSNCSNTKFVIGGYSQGAQVISTSATMLPSDKIIYAATFGDPKLYLPEGRGNFPDACRGYNLSPYREYAPNCYTYIGAFGGQIPYQSVNWQGKIGLWCKDKDIVCGAGLDLSKGGEGNLFERLINSALSSHISYVSDGIFTSAAKTIVSKIQTAYPHSFKAKSSTISNRDTVILLDRTGSMGPYINEYTDEAIRLAKSTLESGGRIALYTYRDLFINQKTERLVDFGCTLEQFTMAINSVKAEGGGDIPESTLGSLMQIMNNQNWRAGATKSIIVLTDANYHDPDYNGETLESVVRRSLEIDPVNVYVISNIKQSDSYQKLVGSTNGRFYIDTISSESTSALLSRPNVNFPLDTYYGQPGSTFYFNAAVSGEITSYEWDLDFDGIFEAKTSSSSITKTYSSSTTGFVQLKVTDKNGNSSTASAQVFVNNDVDPIAKLKNVEVEPLIDGSKISYQKSENTLAVAVKINGILVGYTADDHLEINDLATKANLTLIPISDKGIFGEQVDLELAPLNSDNKEDEGNAEKLRIKAVNTNTLLAPNTGRGN